jgi:acyl-CoA synthetase (AMP-forming)/AMP-acid ligase II
MQGIDGRSAAIHSNFANLLAEAARAFGDRSAILVGERAVSFRALSERAGDIAESLRAAGVRPGDVCGVFVRRPEEAAASFFATLAVGATGILINDLFRPRQIEYVLDNANATALITSAADLELLPRPLATQVGLIRLDDLEPRSRPLEVLRRAPDDCAQVTYTSGSTGMPKGVMMSHANLWAGVRIVAGYLGLRQEDRIASVLPLSFVYGFNQLTTALFTGAVLLHDRSALPQDIVMSLRRKGATVLAAVPPLWQQLLSVASFRDEPLKDLRIVTNAGGRLPVASVKELRRAQPQADLYLMYGLTEVFRSTYLPPSEVDSHPDSIGRAIPDSRVYVVREDGSLCDDGEAGELVHGGPTVGQGYVSDPDATARVFRPNPFLAGDPSAAPPRVAFSGDIVRRDAAGLLYHLGRADQMFKTLGFRVSPDEICEVLATSGEVVESAILTEEDPQRGARIIACVVLKPEGSVERLRRFCGLELPRYMQPTRYELLAAIPRNPSGKQDLIALRERLARTPEEPKP